jgi:tetratricopeptide (TPR) repeat protein
MSLIVFVSSVLLYINTLDNDFVWDDRTLVVENANIRTLDWPTVGRLFTTHYWEITGKPGGLYRPLTALSFYMDHRLYGKDPRGYHLTNVTLNGLVCLLAFLFTLQLFGSKLTALVTALIFASIPLHTENVAWVAGRTDLMATLFMLASLQCYVWWRRRGAVVGLVLSVLAFVAAILAKEFALVLPPIIVLLELGPFPLLLRERVTSKPRVILTTLAFFGIAVLFFAIRTKILGSSVHFFKPFATGFIDTAALSLSILAHYCYKLLFPFVLNAESEFPTPDSFWNFHTLVGLAVIALAAYGVYRWRRRGEIVLGTSILVIGLAPVLNVFPITEVSAERFLYFPSLGFALVVAVLFVAGISRRPEIVAGTLVLLLVAFGTRTYIRNFDWRNEITLFRHTVAVADDNARAHLNLGNAHYRAGRHHQALGEYRQAVEIDPNYAGAWSSSAGAYKALGRLGDAFRCMEMALAIEPNNADYHNSMGILLVQEERYADAAESFRRALQINPDLARGQFNLGLALFKLDDFADAIPAFQGVPHKEIDFVLSYYYLATSESRLGNNGRAAEYAATFLRLYDRDDEFRSNARLILSGSGK